MTGGFSTLGDTDDTTGSDVHFKGHARVRGPEWVKYPLITIGLLGVQIFWSVEMSYASPYLLSLGLTKSYMALVFVAGPLSGLIVQPLIGLLADNSKSRFGRRRPYIVLGGAICILAMLLLGFTNFFASWFTSEGSDANKSLTIWLAVLAIYCIDFAINAVQAMDRALLVDTLRSSQQPSGNAWAARMLGIGSVLGFTFGAIDLERWFSFLGNTELQILSVIACFAFCVTQMMTVIGTEEKVLVSSKRPARTFLQEMKDIVSNMKSLPSDIRQVCFIQFFAWIGWFPFIFYTTTYIGYLHESSSSVYNSPQSSSGDLTKVAEEGTRLGTRAMLCNAVLSLACNIILPYFVDGNTEDEPGKSTARRERRSTPRPWWKINLASLWALSHLVFACCMGATLFTSSVGGTTFLITVSGFSWAVTQWAPFALLAEAILSSASRTSDNRNSILLNDVRTTRNAEEQAGLLASETDIESQDHVVPDPSPEDQRHKPRRRNSAGSGDDSDAADSDDESRQDGSRQTHGRGHDRQGSLSVMGNSHAQLSVLDVRSLDANNLEDGRGGNNDTRKDGLSGKAGIILGIHNIFIVIPQFLVTGLSSIIFALSDAQAPLAHRNPEGATDDTNADGLLEIGSRAEAAEAVSGARAVGLVLRIGGASAIIAFILSWRLAREIKKR